MSASGVLLGQVVAVLGLDLLAHSVRRDRPERRLPAAGTPVPAGAPPAWAGVVSGSFLVVVWCAGTAAYLTG